MNLSHGVFICNLPEGGYIYMRPLYLHDETKIVYVLDIIKPS